MVIGVSVLVHHTCVVNRNLTRCTSISFSFISQYIHVLYCIFLQQKPNPIYADLAVTKRKNRPIPPAPEDNIVVYSELMLKEQADVFRQQLEQKPPPYDDVEISSTSFQTSVTVIPPGIHGDSDVASFKVEGTRVSIKQIERPQNVEETFDNQNPVSHRIPTPEDNQNDIPPPVPTRVFSQHSPRRTPPIPPPTTPPPPPPHSHLSSSSQVSQSGNIPDIIQYSQDEMEKGSTQEDIWKPEPGQLPGSTSSKLEILCLLP